MNKNNKSPQSLFSEPEIAEDFSNSTRHSKEHAKTVFNQSLLNDYCTHQGRVENYGWISEGKTEAAACAAAATDG